GEPRAQVGEVFLAGDLVGADLEDRAGQVKGLGQGAGHAVEKPIHARASLRRGCPVSARPVARSARRDPGWHTVSNTAGENVSTATNPPAKSGAGERGA